MTHARHGGAEEAWVATIEHEGRDDRWGLSYAAPWVAGAQSYPLSPALPLVRPVADPRTTVQDVVHELRHLIRRDHPSGP